MRRPKTQKNSLISSVPEFKRQGVINFDTSEFETTKESLKIYDELNAISKEIDKCRARNLVDILTA